MHVLAAVAWVGGSVFALALGYYLRHRDVETRVEYTRWTEWLGPRYFAPLSVAVIITGPLLADDIGYDLDQTWLTVGFIASNTASGTTPLPRVSTVCSRWQRSTH
jgi:uncharacterized membrane protein